MRSICAWMSLFCWSFWRWPASSHRIGENLRREFAQLKLGGRKCPPPFGQNAFRFTAAMQHGKNLHFIQFDDVKNPVRKTVEIQAADVGKTDGVKLRAVAQTVISPAKFHGELQAQAGTLILIPAIRRLKISADEPVIF